MKLRINFHTLALIQLSSYNNLLEWIVNKKVVLHPKNDEECIKWAVIAGLHRGKIKGNPKRISLLQH